MYQFSLFEMNDDLYWIAKIDNECRMWECPVCKKRMTGQPIDWYQFNYYKYCPYCGTRLLTHLKDVSDESGLP